MRVLIGCEESQQVCHAFRLRGHEAYSCDLLPCSGIEPEYHLQMDVFEAVDLIKPEIGIFFPPCTHLAASGSRSFEAKRKDGRQKEAIKFFKMLYNLPLDKIAIENPVGIMSTVLRKPDQYVQPFHFGDAYAKKTGLWLKNLPLLHPTNIVEPEYVYYHSKKNKSGKSRYSFHGRKPSTNNPEAARVRSITPKGLAEAMADQWG